MKKPKDTMPSAERFLRRREVCELTGLSRSAIYSLMQADKFPKPVKLGEKAVAWPLSDIVAWQQERLAQREATR